MTNKAFDDYVSARSYSLWEREGRPVGHENEFWRRACAEVDAELYDALQGHANAFVPPQLPISRRPIRYSS
jgi:hypothetical protein